MGKKEILQTLGDFSNKENWNEFFAGRGLNNPFEWYAEWPELGDLIVSQLPAPPTTQILVPGCGVSRLSEQLYDAGFQSITNIDFSKVAISNMSRRNACQRPYMRWRVMDMTSMQFMDERFDAILDKGGLDALMVPEDGPMLGNQYLSEVKRVTKSGGKFICFTFAEPHVLDLLLSKFRFGWKISIEEVPENSAAKPSYPSFMVVAEKSDDFTALYPLVSSLTLSSFHFNSTQASEFFEALENENRVREEYSKSNVISYSLEDMQFETERDLKKFHEGHRIKHILGGVEDRQIKHISGEIEDRRVKHLSGGVEECGIKHILGGVEERGIKHLSGGIEDHRVKHLSGGVEERGIKHLSGGVEERGIRHLLGEVEERWIKHILGGIEDRRIKHLSGGVKERGIKHISGGIEDRRIKHLSGGVEERGIKHISGGIEARQIKHLSGGVEEREIKHLSGGVEERGIKHLSGGIEDRRIKHISGGIPVKKDCVSQAANEKPLELKYLEMSPMIVDAA